MQTEIKFTKEAREALKEGVDIIANAVKVSMGAEGRTVVIPSQHGGYIATKDGVSIARGIMPEGNFTEIGASLVKEACTRTNSKAGDGCQPYNSKVLTPKGWVKMGDVKKGDIISGTNGTTQKVQEVYEKEERDIYKVILSDGREVEACGYHIWTVTHNNGRVSNMSTLDMLNSGNIKKLSEDGSYKHGFYIQNTFVDFYEKDLPLDPYTLGVLLGDGSLSGTGSIEISLGKDKEFILDKLVFPEGITTNVSYVENKNYFRIKIVGASKSGKYIKDILEDLKLLGNTSKTKFIPKDYLFTSVNNRQDLLQGLIDTDGYINKRGLLEFSTVSNSLSDDFKELCRGLGIPLNYRLKTDRKGAYSDTPIHCITELKGYKYGYKIEDIVKTDRREPVKCLKVSNSDSLYITDNYVVTHNTTTAAVLLQAIFNDGLKLLDEGVSPVSIKKGIDKAVKDTLEYLDKEAIKVSKDNLKDVTTISVNGDEDLGKLIADAFNQIGENGIVITNKSNTRETYIEIKEGVQLDNGFLDPVFVTDPIKYESVLENPYVLLVKGSINKGDKTVKLFDAVWGKGRDNSLVIICDDIDQFVFSSIAQNIKNGAINGKVCIVRTPQILKINKDLLGDIAMLTGAQIVSDETGVKLGASALGKLDKFVATATESFLIGDIGNLSSTIAELKERIRNEDDDIEKFDLQERLSRISGGVATLFVGASTDSELKEKIDRIEDGINATRAALEEGIVSGGGIALSNASRDLVIKDSNTDFDKGYNLLVKSLLEPFYQITHNAGMESVYPPKEKGVGIDVRTGEVVNMIEVGIIDPKKVTRSALENASSVAGTFLTTEAVVARRK